VWLQKRLPALPGPAIPLTPIRVREKRMNTYKTRKAGRSYQNINNKVGKNLVTTWNLFLPGNVLLTKSCNSCQKRCSTEQENFLEAVMDAKWNNIVDNTMVRVGMVIIGFGAWLAIGYGLLAS